MDDPYRSYVVRVHRARNGVQAVRLDIEDLQGGGRTAMRGPAAGRIARLLTRLVARKEQRAGP